MKMDFFEKAHVTKKETLKKDSKSEENMKRQLKQMLDGFKQSDNKLIRKSENVYSDPNRLLDDSSSVSGFSDLNLTNSSNEGDMRRAHESDEEESTNDLNISKDNEEKKDVTISSTQSSLDSISECKDALESLSEDISNSGSVSSGEDETDNISLISSAMDTNTEADTETSESFDADGALALKIFQKLSMKSKTTKNIANKNDFQSRKKKALPKIIVEDFEQESDEHSVDEFEIDDQMETIDEKEDNSNNSLISSNVSSPFISVSATEMPNHSFSELLGDYRHSTVKNMPSDIQTINTTNETMFSAEFSDNNVITDIDAQSHDEDDARENEFDLSENYSDNVVNETGTDNDTTHEEDTFDHSSMEYSEEVVNPIKVYYARDSCIFILQHPGELYIHGKVNIKALGGTVEIFGYTLKDEVCKVYAPNYNNAHCVKTIDCENAYYGLFSKLTSAGLSVYEAEEIVTTIGPCDGVVCISPLKCKQMDYVENNFASTDLFSKVNRNIDRSLRQPSAVLGCSLYGSKPWKCFEENASWRQAVKYGLRKQSRGLVCGGKGVGKSTFLRYCVNRLLNEGPVLVVDLDPGQTEFTVAGSVSATVVTEPLLGPNFTHLRKPDRMLYLGMINTMDNRRRYAAAVAELITHCLGIEDYQRMPWIVNTMGMCNAMGLKFITHIILHTQPTYLLQIDSKSVKKRFQCYLNPGAVKNMCNDEFKYDSLFKNAPVPESLNYSFFVCDPMENLGKKDFSLAPRDERYLNYLAYFGELLRTGTDEALLGITPYEVNFRDLHLGLNVRVPPDAALKVINGKVVALCQLPRSDVTVFTLKDKPLLCHGHGLVRGVDYEKEKLYMITACTELADVNTLVYADWVPELRGAERPGAPYRAAAGRQQRPLMAAPRRRFNPLQLLKMSRSS